MSTFFFFVFLVGCDEKYHHVFDFVNDGIDNIHIFIPTEEEQSQANRIAPERSREFVIKLDKEEEPDGGIEYVVEAHRGETLMASTYCPPSDGDTSYEVVYTDFPSLDCMRVE